MAGADRSTGRKKTPRRPEGRCRISSLRGRTCQRIERDSSSYSVSAFCYTQGPFINSLKTAELWR